MSKRKVTTQLPTIDGKCEPGMTYFTKNARVDNNTKQLIPTKKQVIKEFTDRFGYTPAEVFYGKPNGSIVYAGPLTRNPDPIEDRPAEDTGDLQLSLSL